MKFLSKAIDEAVLVKNHIVNDYFGDKQIEIDIHDAVTIAFVEDMAQKAKTLKLLIENNTDYLDSVSRNIFELSIYLKLLLSKDNEIYGRSYRAYTIYRGCQMYQSIVAQDKLGAKIRQHFDINREDFITNSPDDVGRELEGMREKYADVFEFRRERDAWYNLDGKTKNFEQLCIKLGEQANYEIFYRLMSSEVHSLDVLNRWKFESDSIYILNDFKDKRMHINMTFTLLFEAIESVYKFYGLSDRFKKFKALITVNYGL